ncbi:hypothetical protein Q9L58_005621 [Maublancomyces gigas]|uniref:Uncharacterized protein n=1 Tax=Discina gigas TaxID=1032678 RepID=A0ABR3GHJ1_9PEZI
MDLETKLAYTAEALALKSNLLYSDLPNFLHHVMIHFNPPLVHCPGFLCHTYNLGAVRDRRDPASARDHARGLGRVPVWAPSEAVMAVVNKWSDQPERECELEQWVAATARIVGRLQRVVAGADTPVAMIGAARWRGGAYASGVADSGALVRRLVGSVVGR